MKKIFKLTIFTLLLFFSVATIAVSSFAWYVSIIIVYYNYEDGSEAAPTYREKDPVYGVTYHIDSPKIEGYKPDMEYVEYTYAGTKAFWVTYYADGYNLIINYLDEDGNKISDSYNKILSKDSNYEIESPIIDGYIADQEVVSGTLDSDKEINVIYTRNKFNLTINYKDIDGNTVSNSYKETLIKNTE